MTTTKEQFNIPAELAGGFFTKELENAFKGGNSKEGIEAKKNEYDCGLPVLNDFEASLYGFLVEGFAEEVDKETARKKLTDSLKAQKSIVLKNSKLNEGVKKIPELANVGAVSELAQKRPAYRLEGVVKKARLKRLEEYLSGHEGISDLFDEAYYEEVASRSISETTLGDDVRATCTKGACLGLAIFFVSDRERGGGENVEAQQVCLSCPVFASCGSVALISGESIGVRVALSERKMRNLRSAVGANSVRGAINGPYAEVFHAAVKGLFSEYQEIIDPLGFGASQKRVGSVERNASNHNKRATAQLGLALRCLAENFSV